jgi:PAS domain S-box-containing protein
MELQTKNREPTSVSTIAPDSEADSSRLHDRHLLRVLEAANVIPWEADPQTWRFTYVGSQAERLLGYPIDRWYEDDFWTSTIFPEDRESAIEFCATSCKTLRDFEFQYRMKRADGEVIWLHDIVNVEMDDGVPQALRGFMIDITAIKRLEETLRIEHDLLAESLDKYRDELTLTTERSEQAHLALRKADDEKTQAIHGMQKLRPFLKSPGVRLSITSTVL